MRKLLIWLALVPIALVVGMIAFSPKGAVGPATSASASAQASTVTLKPTARPVMYEFFTGW
jgi:hypothetical protein